MPTLFIHAGAPKTGTSYLQVQFARHAAELARLGLVYPDGRDVDQARLGRITSGNGLAMANYICPHLPHPIADKDAFLADFQRHLSEAAGRNVLYSSEWLRLDPGERTAALARTAAGFGYDIRFIYLVRDFAPAAYSAYSQQIKND